MICNNQGVHSTAGMPGLRKLTRFSVTTPCRASAVTPG